jgi:hypothetical protein
VAALFAGPVTSGGVIFIMTLSVLTLGYGALDRFLLLRRRLRSITDGGQQEKGSIERTLNRVSNELARLFSQERRSRELLPALQDYLRRLTPGDVYQATRFTAPHPQSLMLPGPPDRETPGDAGPAEGNEGGYARGFPEWTPQPPTRARQLPDRPSPH